MKLLYEIIDLVTYLICLHPADIGVRVELGAEFLGCDVGARIGHVGIPVAAVVVARAGEALSIGLYMYLKTHWSRFR